MSCLFRTILSCQPRKGLFSPGGEDLVMRRRVHNWPCRPAFEPAARPPSLLCSRAMPAENRLQSHRCRDCRDRGTRNIPGTPQFAWHGGGGGPGVVARVEGSLPGQVGGTRGARATPPNTTIANPATIPLPVQLAMQPLPPPPARLQPRCRVQGAVLVETRWGLKSKRAAACKRERERVD